MTQEIQTYRKQALDFQAYFADEITKLDPCPSSADNFQTNIHMADANLRWFLPQLDAVARTDILTDVLLQQRLALNDQSDYGLIKRTQLIDNSGVQFGGAVVYCTYHIGSYRHFFHWLIQEGIDCLLFVAEKTLHSQGESFLRDSVLGAKSGGRQGKLEMVNAETRSSVLAGARAIKRGKSVAIYIDGNTGVGNNKDNNSMQEVNFFGKKILARGGVAWLAHLSGVPVVPVTCERNDSFELSLTLHPALHPDLNMSREAWVTQTTQTLYSLLELRLRPRLGQWEGWFYVHKFLKRETSSPRGLREATPMTDKCLRADVTRFALVMFGAQPVLLDKQRHSFILLNNLMAAMFRSAVKNGLRSDDASSPEVLHLFNLEALLQEV